MGLTICSKNKEINMATSDFQELRKKIASFLPHEIYSHYCEMLTPSAQLG